MNADRRGGSPDAVPGDPGHPVRVAEATVAALAVGLGIYCFTPELATGDAAAYVEEATALFEGGGIRRGLHAGYVLVLAGLLSPGLPADAAANTASAAFGALCLLSVRSISLSLGAGRLAALVPVLLLLGAAPFLEAALLAEVYGPAAALLAAAIAALLRGSPGAAGALAGLGGTCNPAVLAWIPCLVVLSRRAPRDRLRVAALAAAPFTLLAALLPGAVIFGTRGALAALAGDVHPWISLQRAFRLGLDAAPATGALLVLGLALPAGRAYARAWALGFAATALLADRRSDVPAHLLSLVALAPLSALGAGAVAARAGDSRFPAAAAVAILLVFQAGEGSSRHDRARRLVERRALACREAARMEPDVNPVGAWGAVTLCRHQAPGLQGGRRPGAPVLFVPPGRAPAGSEIEDVKEMPLRVVRLGGLDTWWAGSAPGAYEIGAEAPREDQTR